MNKAAAAASGEWIMYINAGDALFDKNVLSRISAEIPDDADVIFGDAVLAENGHCKLLKAGSVRDFKYVNPICHQASLTRRDVVCRLGFDTGYRIAADFDMFLKIALSGEKRFEKLDAPLCIFSLGGISNASVSEREKEFDRSRKANGSDRVPFPGLQIIKNVCTERVRMLAVRLLGERFYSEKRGWYRDKHGAGRIGETDV